MAQNSNSSRIFTVRRRVLATSIAALLAMASVPTKSSAADRTWDDGGATFNWSDALNWDSNTVPVDTDKLIFGNHNFGGPGPEVLNNDLVSFQAGGLLFNGGLAQGGYNITGNLFVILNQGIDQASQASQTISAAIFLGANQTWAGTAGNLNVTGSVIGFSGFDLRVTGNFSTEITGNISGTGTSIEIDGTSTLRLTGTNSYDGGTIFTSGNIVITNGSALGSGPATFTNGGLIAAGTFAVAPSALTFNAGTSLVGASVGEVFTLNSPNLVIGAGANLVFGSIGSAGTVIFANSSGSFSIDPTATLRVAGGTLRGGVFLDVVTDSVASTTIDAGATLDLNNDSGNILNLQGAGTFQLGTSTTSFTQIQSGTFSGAIRGNGNLIKNNAAGTLLITGGATEGILIGGAVRVNDGVLQLNNTGFNTGLRATGGVFVGLATGAANSDILRLLNNSQISDTTDVTVNLSGLFDTNGFFERVGALTINDGRVKLDNAPNGQALVVGGLLTMTGGSITGAVSFNSVVLLGDVVATSSALNTAAIDSPVDVNGTRIFTINDGPAAVDLALNGVVGDSTDPGRIVKEGAGTLGLFNAGNTYSGGTQINAGTVRINNGGAFGTGNVNFGGTTGQLEFIGGPTTVNKTIVVDTDSTGRISNNSASNATVQGFLVLSSNARIAFGSATATGTIILESTGGFINFGQQFSVDFGTVRNGTVSAIEGFTLQTDTTTVAAGATLDIFGFNTQITNLQGGGTLTNTGAALANYTINGGTFSGAINGGALTRVTKSSANTLTLSGASNYTGGTTLNNGRLITQNSAALGTGGIDLNGGVLQPQGQLTVGPTNWVSGNISLRLSTTDLLTATTFTDGNGATTNTYEFDITGVQQPGTFTVTTFGAPIGFVDGNSFSAVSTDGITTLQGFFTLNPNNVQFTLTGATVTGNTIQNSPPTNTPTFADFIINGPVATGGGNENNTIKSLVFGPQGGSLTVFNTLLVTDGNVFTPTGSAIVLGAPGGPQGNLGSNVTNNGTLSGNGTIFGNLVNNGLVSPGFSPGKITVTGNYTQSATGTLRIEVGGTSESEYDVLVVGGYANLGGTLDLVRTNGYQPKRGDKVTFLTAGLGVHGEFDSINNPFESQTILAPEVLYGEHEVTLEMVRGSFEKLTDRLDLTPNQRSVAGALDSLSSDNADHQALVYLDERHLQSLPGDFDDLAPEELSSIFAISTSLANVQSTNLQRRTDDIRSGAGGFSAAGLAINGQTPSYSGSFGIATGVAGPTGAGKDVKETKTVLVPDEKNWGVFLSGTGEWVDVDGDGNARGYDITTGGFTLGLDYKVSPNFAVGIAAGYAGTAADLTNDGRVWVNGGKLGLYATYFSTTGGGAGPSGQESKDVIPAPEPITGTWYVDLAATGGYNCYDTKRSALKGTARGSTEGGELNTLIGTGYDWQIGALSIGPTATFQYTLVGMGGFTEHGSLAPLEIESREAESIRSALGFKASYDWKLGGVIVKPEIRAAWQHEYGDTSYALAASFSGGGDQFLVNGPELGRDSLLVGGGVAVMFSETFSTYVYYDGELLRENYQSHSVSGGFRVAF